MGTGRTVVLTIAPPGGVTAFATRHCFAGRACTTLVSLVGRGAVDGATVDGATVDGATADGVAEEADEEAADTSGREDCRLDPDAARGSAIKLRTRRYRLRCSGSNNSCSSEDDEMIHLI
jgi:hypothetical protein